MCSPHQCFVNIEDGKVTLIIVQFTFPHFSVFFRMKLLSIYQCESIPRLPSNHIVLIFSDFFLIKVWFFFFALFFLGHSQNCTICFGPFRRSIVCTIYIHSALLPTTGKSGNCLPTAYIITNVGSCGDGPPKKNFRSISCSNLSS